MSEMLDEIEGFCYAEGSPDTGPVQGDQGGQVKTCSSCGKIKQLSEFSRYCRALDGLQRVCKRCQNEYTKRRYRRKKEEIRHKARENLKNREFDRLRHKNPGAVASAAKRSALWYNNRPDARRAKDAVSYALKTGRLVKGCCEVCDTTERIHAHHEDYSKPLDVHWLCALHHRRLHAGLIRLSG